MATRMELRDDGMIYLNGQKVEDLISYKVSSSNSRHGATLKLVLSVVTTKEAEEFFNKKG